MLCTLAVAVLPVTAYTGSDYKEMGDRCCIPLRQLFNVSCDVHLAEMELLELNQDKFKEGYNWLKSSCRYPEEMSTDELSMCANFRKNLEVFSSLKKFYSKEYLCKNFTWIFADDSGSLRNEFKGIFNKFEDMKHFESIQKTCASNTTLTLAEGIQLHTLIKSLCSVVARAMKDIRGKQDGLLQFLSFQWGVDMYNFISSTFMNWWGE